jgi:formylglycine-generating enzyme required for sulfatase activity
VPLDKTRDQLQRGEPKETFYISRYKITRGQFRIFAAEDPKNVTDSRRRWEKHAADTDRMPVRDVTVTDACAFARWLGGKLPHPDQWDKAAGCFHPNRGRDPYWEGPFKGRWNTKIQARVAVRDPRRNVFLPVPVDAPEDEDDESVYRCRGMAGNGFEWTRLTINRMEVPLKKVWGITGENVILRGWSFKEEVPATFEKLESNERSEGYEQTEDYLSFRVVLEPNG